VKTALSAYEGINGSNESSHWLYIELLWREYFIYLHYCQKDKTFSFQGTAKTAPLTSFYPERFKKWCEGETPYQLVNACMKELKETGYLSNRGRQIVASCLVNELGVDWRYGAAWFEHCLIDYDVAVNWGNWQYIAGVGADPRGGRHFNIQKQTELYDPDFLYQKRWGAQSRDKLDSRDAADWPIS
jgi:deoxyribodipyrimidine photo-lyase